ncbi:type 2 isopentenyl-diphosphate Delta-isomerase [Litorilinea aerophila]|uniref:Isopentenyl-diphosphate delta-isomerase n=1 Tax=Litorilinea aerophila TaxID=1204385 RepID=A0A540V954_9CHLR|nr:type 2 isopentenyl-diphosphate Delta-isomerase [Litorilinea aerophila]MCC9078820.1 type 2 isopentenyl-diphosphate Delta-isomerase [Litorilinea aerophila]
MSIETRKADHIRINLEEDVQFPQLTTGLERFRFVHQALPELDLDEVDLHVEVFGRRLSAPILVSSMTGGTPEAGRINRVLAQAAQARGLAMGLGSQRAGLEQANTAETFRVRDVAPGLFLFANLGAIQLNYGYTVEHCRRAVEMVEADALILHLNPLQEVLQAEGDTRWRGLLRQIEAVCRALPVPVVAKEVGWGISAQTARRLIDAGIRAIDVAGAGGTSWSQVEMHRAPTERLRRLAASFADWGIPTADSLLAVRQVRAEMGREDVALFASGGIRSGQDIAKCVALGADLVGLASPFLKRAVESVEAVIEEMEILETEMRIAMFCSGAANIAALRQPGVLVQQPEGEKL